MTDNEMGYLGSTPALADRIQSVAQWCAFYNLAEENMSVHTGQEQKTHSLVGSQTHSLFLVWTCKAPSDWVSQRFIRNSFGS